MSMKAFDALAISFEIFSKYDPRDAGYIVAEHDYLTVYLETIDISDIDKERLAELDWSQSVEDAHYWSIDT